MTMESIVGVFGIISFCGGFSCGQDGTSVPYAVLGNQHLMRTFEN
jgi:hypothetical protein